MDILESLMVNGMMILKYEWGDPKIAGIIFLKWFIRFYTITTPVSFKVLSFWLNTLDTEGGQK